MLLSINSISYPFVNCVSREPPKAAAAAAAGRPVSARHSGLHQFSSDAAKQAYEVKREDYLH